MPRKKSAPMHGPPTLSRSKRTLMEELLGTYADSISPDNTGLYEEYRDRPLDFIENVLGVHLWDKQKELIRAVWEHPKVVVKSATGVGKTFAGASLMATIFKVYADVEIYAAAAPPIDNLRRLLWGELTRVIQNSGAFQIDTTDKVTSLRVERLRGGMVIPKQFIEGVTIPTSGDEDTRKAKFSGKHQDALVFIFDEGDAIPDEVYEAADGCLSGGAFQRLIVFFNPKRRAGKVFRMVKDREAYTITISAFDHPNVITGDMLIPGAVTRDVTIKRIYEWTRPLDDDEREELDISRLPEGVFAVPQFLIGATAPRDDGGEYPPLAPGYRRVTDPQFSYKVLGEFPPEGETTLVPYEAIAAARSRWDLWVAGRGEKPPENVQPIVGMDVAEYGTDSHAVAMRYGDWLAPIVTKQNMDPADAAVWAARLADEADAREVRVDAIGVGAGVPSILYGASELFYNVTGVKVSERARGRHELGFFYQLRDELYFLLAAWIKNGTSMIPPDQNLVDALNVLEYQVLADGRIRVTSKDVMRKLLGHSPDEMEALLMTFAGPRTDFGRV